MYCLGLDVCLQGFAETLIAGAPFIMLHKTIFRPSRCYFPRQLGLPAVGKQQTRIMFLGVPLFMCQHTGYVDNFTQHALESCLTAWQTVLGPGIGPLCQEAQQELEQEAISLYSSGRYIPCGTKAYVNMMRKLPVTYACCFVELSNSAGSCHKALQCLHVAVPA